MRARITKEEQEAKLQLSIDDSCTAKTAFVFLSEPRSSINYVIQLSDQLGSCLFF